MFLGDIFVGELVAELLLIAAIALVLFIVFKFRNFILGIILNSILGLIAIWLANSFFMLGITYDWITWIVVAVFGLPAVAIIIILKLIGISI